MKQPSSSGGKQGGKTGQQPGQRGIASYFGAPPKQQKQPPPVEGQAGGTDKSKDKGAEAKVAAQDRIPSEVRGEEAWSCPR